MTIMKILILNPPFLPRFSRAQRSPAVTKSGTLYFPIWLAYCVGVLEAEGHVVSFVDAPARGVLLSETVQHAKAFQPRLIVMDTSTPSIQNDLQVAEAIRRILPDGFITLVGPHVSALPEKTLCATTAVNAIARREYEYTIRDLARLLENPAFDMADMAGMETVHGLSFRNANGVVHNPDRPFIDNLDDLPWVSKVYKKHLNIRDYFNPNALFPMVTLITSRGCPFRCSFCVYPQVFTGRKYRFRSIRNVIDEIEYVIQEIPDIKSIFFEDDTLTASKNRCIRLADSMIERGIRIPWTANSRVDLDFDTMKKIRDAGCRQLCVGFESSDQGVLDSMKKGIKIERMHQFMRDAKRAGILIHGCFIIGFPGDTRESINRTIDLSIQLKPDTVQFYPVMVYPGTEAYDVYARNAWITSLDYHHWITGDGLHNCVVRNETLTSEDLVRMCDQARRRFYLRPGYVMYKLFQMLGKPAEFVRTIKSARTFFKHLLKGSRV